MSTDTVIPLIVCGTALALASAVHLRTLRIYNWLTFPLLLTGVVYHYTVSGVNGIFFSVFAGAVAFCSMLFLYLLGAMGAGDVKLSAGLGAWLGLPHILLLLSAGLLVSALVSVSVLLWQRRLGDAWLNLKLTCCRLSMLAQHVSRDDQHESVHDLAKTAAGRRRLMPFSIMLGVGLVLILTFSFISTV